MEEKKSVFVLTVVDWMWRMLMNVFNKRYVMKYECRDDDDDDDGLW